MKTIVCMYYDVIKSLVLAAPGYSMEEIKKYRDRFRTLFLDKVVGGKDYYYMFMITVGQKEDFLNELKSHKITGTIVKEIHGIRNQNYRNREHQTISIYVLNFPVGYKP
jgi:hypothetical protein